MELSLTCDYEQAEVETGSCLLSPAWGTFQNKARVLGKGTIVFFSSVLIVFYIFFVKEGRVRPNWDIEEEEADSETYTYEY